MLLRQCMNNHRDRSVKEYKSRFIKLMTPLDDIPESIAQAQFTSKLKDEIKNEMRVIGPRSLDDAMVLAVQIEEKLSKKASKRWESRSVFTYGPSTYPNPTYNTTNRTHTQKYNQSTYSVFSSPSVSSQSSPTQIGLPIAKPFGKVIRLSEKNSNTKEGGDYGLGVMTSGQWAIGVK